MNKAFEKILERLDEELRKSEERYYRYLDDGNLPCIFDKSDIEETVVCTIKEALDTVHEVAEEYNGGWVPCSERLPEEELEKAKKERGSEAVFPVLATINKKHFVTGEKYTTVSRAFYGCYNDKNFYNSCCDKLDVIAWQPLPEPYKERD